MKPSELEAAIREKQADPSILIHDMTDNGGYGLVRYSRDIVAVGGPNPVTVTEHVVHRWAVKDTDGRDIPLLLYSGGYFEDDYRGNGPSGQQLADADFRRRIDPPLEYLKR